MSLALEPEILNAGKAIGLLTPQGDLDPSWFGSPVSRLENILREQSQRDAFLELIDDLIPGAPVAGSQPGEEWHPLLGENPRGNAYLTVRTAGGRVIFGAAGDLRTSASGGLPSATLSAQLPVISLQGSSAGAIAGTADGPLAVNLRVRLDWTRPAQAIGLRAVRVRLSLAPLVPSVQFEIVLEGLDLDGTGARDAPLDPAHLDSQAIDLILGLFREKLRQIAGSATGEAAAVAGHLMPLFGLGGGIPAFPFHELLNGPAALQGWLNSLITGGQITAWLGHLAGLFGSAAAVNGQGTASSPWTVRILDLGPAGSQLEAALAHVDGKLRIGVRAVLVPNAVNPPVRVEADAVLAGIPLSGTGSAEVLPSASVMLGAPGDATALVPNNVTIGVDSLRAGVLWNGVRVTPVLELFDVDFGGVHYEVLDLTSADSVISAASAGVRAAILAAIGNTGPGPRLAALAGLVAPSGDPSSPFLVDATQLVANPTRAIAAVHRNALLDATHNWGFLLAEAGALIGLAGPVSGTGTKPDPWRMTIATAGPVSIELAAWNAQETGNAADPQSLRLGLRLSAGSAPWTAWWLAELLAFDLPVSGSGDVRLMAGQHASFLFTPSFSTPPFEGMTVSIASFGATLDWEPGGSLVGRGVITNLTVAANGDSVTVPSIVFPGGPGLGVNTNDLSKLVSMLAARASYGWAGMPGMVATSLVGIHGRLPGLPANFPTLGPAVFTDPLAALREWLNQVAAGGSPHLLSALAWLRALLANQLPDLKPVPLTIEGDGVYESPWRVPVGSADLLFWLEPAGPPQSWGAAIQTALAGGTRYSELLDAARSLGSFIPSLREAMAFTSSDAAGAALNNLEDYLEAGDGVVPLESQLPSGGTWTAGTLLECAHHKEPQDASAIAQIQAQLNAWNPAQRAVLLLGPAFSDRTIWTALLGVNASGHFNLRVPNTDPLTVDLNPVTTVADYYTADLLDDGVGNLESLTGQIARVVARIGALRPGVKVTLVAHSTAGVAARVFTAANPSLVLGLITLGTPHLGASLVPLRDSAQAEGLRVLQRAGNLPAGALKDAVDHLIEALDGYLPPSAPGQLPRFRPYPIGSFTAPGGTDTGGVQALAIGSRIAVKVFDQFEAALNSAAAGVAGLPPTHLGFGIQSKLAIPAPLAGQVSVDAFIRVDAGRVALQEGAPEPARPKHAVIKFNSEIRRPDGWLAGTPQSFAGEGTPLADVRVRWAEIGATIVPSNGSIAVTPVVRLHGAAFHSDTLARVDLGAPQAEPLIGEVLRVLSGPDAPAGSPASVFVDALGALGLTVPDPAGGVGLSADAFAAILVDARGYLAPRIAPALSRPGGLLGFNGPVSGPWIFLLGNAPLDVYVNNGAGFTVGMRTRTPLTAGDSLAATFDARLAVPAMTGALDLAVKLGLVELNFSSATGQLALAAPPYVHALTLKPAPSPATLVAAIEQALPRILLSGAVAALLEATLGPLVKVGAIDRVLGAPGQSLGGPGSLGDAARINQLLHIIAIAIGPPPAGPGIDLPGGLHVEALGTGTVTVRLQTTAPIAGVLGFELDANIDPLRNVTPAGTLTLTLPLPGTWGNVVITFGISPAGVSLTIQPIGADPIQLLPTFSGLGALAGVAQALLPAVLDAIVNSFGVTPPKLIELSVNLAKAFDLADNAGSFQARAANWKATLQGDWLATFTSPAVRQNVAQAFVNLFNDAASPLNGVLPGAFSASGGLVTWSAAPISLALGWDGGGPAITVAVTGFKPANGPLSLTLQGGRVSGNIQAQASIGFSLQSSLRVAATPEFAVAFNGTGFAVHFLPLGAGTASALDIELLPSPAVHTGSAGPLELVTKWLLPITADLLVEAVRSKLALKLWSTGPTVSAVLQSAGILNGADQLVLPLPSLESMVAGLLTGLVSNVDITVTPTLKIRFVNEVPAAGGPQRLGVRLVGHQAFQAGQLQISVLFGRPATWISDAKAGITVYLFNSSGLTFNPLLQVIGLGAGFSGDTGAPLINTNFLRLGAFFGYLFFDLNLSGGVSASRFGAGVELEDFGLPLGQALSGNAGGNNPVAASLLQSDAGGGGDPNPVNPGVSVIAAFLHPNTFIFKIGGQEGAFWIGVRRNFGPIYIEQIGLEMREAKSKVALLVDGSVKVNGLAVGVDDLSVVIPLKKLTTPAEWSLDLRGMAVGFQQPGLSIAGGLSKNPGPPVTYDGMLQVDIAGKGFTAVGSYARPTDELGEYTSLFIFVSIPIPLGGPPAFFVLGLGGGAGYNRQLIVPTDLNAIPNFLLVAAIDNPSFANDPMRALRDMAVSIPPKRGSFWLAAGLKFSSFVIVNTTAVLYVAVDRGFEIGILGVSRMALPAADFAIANIELALKARFNSAEGILSIQAQLTDNSYIFHPSCQLTGGFAFFIWFPQGQFLLTLGGYHPAFQKRPEYPDVPRLGFRWSMGPVTIKGEAYFALTNSCVMAGGRLEAVYKLGPIRAWFICWADILISWDPFHYDISMGVQIGVRVEFRVCFIVCGTVRIGLTLGASLHIIGPPLYAEVTIDAYITTVTISFGDPPRPDPNYITDFDVFKARYLTAGDQEAKAVGVRVTQGMLPPEPPGAQPAPGTREQPWRIIAEFAFLSETRMPARSFQQFVSNTAVNDPGASEIDLAPMNKINVGANHRVQIFRVSNNTAPPVDNDHWVFATTIGLFPEATWNFTDPKKQRAASETIPGVSGLSITGVAVLVGQSALIPIVGVVDDLPSRAKPLPFATNTIELKNKLIAFGMAANTLLGDLTAVPSSKMIAGAEQVLSAGGQMAELRVSAGLPAGGISPLARYSLRAYRSAPPLIAPLTTGLTMDPVGLEAPPAVLRMGDVLPVFVERPVLKAVLASRPQPVEDSPPALHTSVRNIVITTRLPRMSPPKPVVLTGARLERVAAERSPRPTERAFAARTVHNPDTGVLAGPAHAAQFERAAGQLMAEGVKVPAGATHIWELPGHEGRMSFVIRGAAAVRAVFLDRSGRPVVDREYLIANEETIAAPAGAFTLALTCLGRALSRAAVAPGFAAVTFGLAPAGAFAIAGWQTGNLGNLVAAATILAHGAAVVLPTPFETKHRNQAATLGAVRISEAVHAQPGTETWLPKSATVVLIVLDGQDPTAAADGDLEIAVEDATLATPPIPVGGGRRRALLYDVSDYAGRNDYFQVAVASRAGWRLAGIAGLKGKAIEWANRFHDDVPERLVPEGPLTADGAVFARAVEIAEPVPAHRPKPVPRKRAAKKRKKR